MNSYFKNPVVKTATILIIAAIVGIVGAYIQMNYSSAGYDTMPIISGR